MQRYQPSAPTCIFLRIENSVLEHRFSGCCLPAFGDPKTTFHDLRNKKGSLFLKRHVLKKHKKGFQKNSPHKIFQYYSIQKSHSAGPLQRHVSFFLVGFYEVSIWRISLCAWDALLSPAALPDVRWKYSTNNIQQNHGKWNEWWERVTTHTQKLAGGNSNIFGIFTPNPGEIIQFDEHIFQMGWNHQLENHKRVLEELHWSNKNHDSPGQDTCLFKASFFSLNHSEANSWWICCSLPGWLVVGSMPPLLGSKIFLRASDFPPVSDVVSIVP